MPLTSLLPLLRCWLWIVLAGAGLVLFEAGPGQQFWFLIVSAGASWISLRLFGRYLARNGR